jgi:hypothetical protein
MPETQECRVCGVEKPLDEFQFRADTGRHRTECKDCQQVRKNAWRKSNPQRHREYQRRYSQTHEMTSAEETYKYNAKSMPGAYNAGQEWSEMDNETVMRDDLSISEIARRLGRTYLAVTFRRNKLRQG